MENDTNIYFFANLGDETDNQYTIVIEEKKTVREMIAQVLDIMELKINGSIEQNLEKYGFLFGNKFLNDKKFLDLTIKEAGIKNGRTLKVYYLDKLIPA
jgi:hypothetical protein